MQQHVAVPQANEPWRIAATVDAVAAGCVTATEIAEALDLSDRQGNYYAAAALHAGLLDRTEAGPFDSSDTWLLTTEGTTLANITDAGRKSAHLAGVLANDSTVNAVLTADDVRRTLAEIADDWRKDTDLGETTISRRLSTVRAWATFVETAAEQQAALVATVTDEVAARAPQVAEQRQQRIAQLKAKRQAAAPKFCSDCYMQLPATGVCNFGCDD